MNKPKEPELTIFDLDGQTPCDELKAEGATPPDAAADGGDVKPLSHVNGNPIDTTLIIKEILNKFNIPLPPTRLNNEIIPDTPRPKLNFPKPVPERKPIDLIDQYKLRRYWKTDDAGSLTEVFERPLDLGALKELKEPEKMTTDELQAGLRLRLELAQAGVAGKGDHSKSPDKIRFINYLDYLLPKINK